MNEDIEYTIEDNLERGDFEKANIMGGNYNPEGQLFNYSRRAKYDIDPDDDNY
jgi:hypothetical protein